MMVRRLGYDAANQPKEIRDGDVRRRNDSITTRLSGYPDVTWPGVTS